VELYYSARRELHRRILTMEKKQRCLPARSVTKFLHSFLSARGEMTRKEIIESFACCDQRMNGRITEAVKQEAFLPKNKNGKRHYYANPKWQSLQARKTAELLKDCIRLLEKNGYIVQKKKESENGTEK
jgi:hypothetical protein